MKVKFLIRQMYHPRMLGYTYEPGFVCVTCSIDLSDPEIIKILKKQLPNVPQSQYPVNYYGFIEFMPEQGLKRLNRNFG